MDTHRQWYIFTCTHAAKHTESNAHGHCNVLREMPFTAQFKIKKERKTCYGFGRNYNIKYTLSDRTSVWEDKEDNHLL